MRIVAVARLAVACAVAAGTLVGAGETARADDASRPGRERSSGAAPPPAGQRAAAEAVGEAGRLQAPSRAGLTVAYPVRAAATRYSGAAFDTCTAPSAAAMRAWERSPYRGIGVYVGGPNRGCAQPNLTASWVRTVSRRGWKLLPIYVGLQAPCADRSGFARISRTPATAAAQGASSARDAVSRLGGLGMTPGSIVYLDIENYAPGDSGCRVAVLQYVTGYTRELHRQGFLSGVYGNAGSAMAHLSAAYGSGTYLRPDAVWLARWDGVPRLTGWPDVPDTRWAQRQRMKQYRGDHAETHGGVRLVIDSNTLDAPAATVPYDFRATTAVRRRAWPTTTSAQRGTLPSGATARIVCQTTGQKVAGTALWNKLSDGSYVSGAYVDTPSRTGYHPLIPRCTYLYQVTAPSGVVTRAAPNPAARRVGVMPLGTLAWISCQGSGALVAGTRIWDRTDTGAWLTDQYVATPGRNSWSGPIPRC